MPEAPFTHSTPIRSTSRPARTPIGAGPTLDVWTVLLLLTAGWLLHTFHESLDATVARATNPFQAERIDPRRASLAEWTLIPGVGPGLGRRLHEAIPHRHAAGLVEVTGIGPVTARNAARHLRLVPSGDEEVSP